MADPMRGSMVGAMTNAMSESMQVLDKYMRRSIACKKKKMRATANAPIPMRCVGVRRCRAEFGEVDGAAEGMMGATVRGGFDGVDSGGDGRRRADNVEGVEVTVRRGGERASPQQKNGAELMS